MKIAIIDDGINTGYYGSVDRIDESYIVTDENRILRNKPGINKNSHGTTCAAIIRNYTENARLISIKILESGNGPVKKLHKAIKWCYKNDIRLINLSLGTRVFNDFYEMKKIINFVRRKKIIIVAACSNKNTITYPACFPEVISVQADNYLESNQYYFNEKPYNGTDISASGRHCLKLFSGLMEETLPSNSYATPLITAKVCDIINCHNTYDIDKIKEYLLGESLNSVQLPIYYNDIPSSDPGVILDIPIIEISRSNLRERSKKDIVLIYQLESLFRNDGYYAVSIIEKGKGSYNITGREVFCNKGDYNWQLKWYYRKYNCDVIIYQKPRVQNIKADISIQIEKNDVFIINDMRYVYKGKNKYIGIYKLIKEWLTEESQEGDIN